MANPQVRPTLACDGVELVARVALHEIRPVVWTCVVQRLDRCLCSLDVPLVPVGHMAPVGGVEFRAGDIDAQTPAAPSLPLLEVVHAGGCDEPVAGPRRRAVEHELLATIGAGAEVLVDAPENRFLGCTGQDVAVVVARHDEKGGRHHRTRVVVVSRVEGVDGLGELADAPALDVDFVGRTLKADDMFVHGDGWFVQAGAPVVSHLGWRAPDGERPSRCVRQRQWRRRPSP